MRSLLAPRHYLSEEAFRAERDLLFGRLWQFLTLKALVGRNNAFVTRTLSGIPIVVQNFRGEIRAFENVCLHRHALLQWEPEGERPLVCRYHAWGYNVRGEPENIPGLEDIYRLSEEERRGLRLHEFPLEIIGNLVFVHLGADPLPITDQFSPEFIESLRASSTQYDDEVMLTTFHGRFNWKLAYENLRDSNHPRFVHAQTLAKAVTFRPSIDEALVADAKALRSSGPLSRERGMELLRRFSWAAADAPLDGFPHLEWHDHIDRWGSDDVYYNWLAFPNLHIASATGGCSFIVEHHVPVAPGKTDLIVHWVTARKKARYAWSPAVLYSHMVGARSVLAEDVGIMERVQAGLRESTPPAVMGDYEGVNLLVEKWHTDLMEKRFAL